MKRILSLLLVCTTLLIPLSGLAQTTPSTEDWLDITVDMEYSDTASFLDNPNDVVTPYVEDLFKIRIKEVIQGGLTTIGFKERLATYIASNNMPDVIIAGNDNCAYAVGTGYYGDGYEDLIENEMPNLNARFDSQFWPRYMNEGRKTQIPLTIVDTRDEPYVSDPYTVPLGQWALWVREDLLSKCGYTFTPIKEISAATTEQGIMPSVDDFAITPAIATPEDFQSLLQKIADLNISVGDAKLTPFSSIDWSQFHVGSMFDFGHWRIADNGDVGGFLGESTGAKQFYQYLNGLYQGGLIDPDFIVQTSDQLQQKISAGRVGAGMYIPDMTSAQTALYQTVGDDASIRFITWPKEDDSGLGAYDIYEGGFWRIIIRSDLSREQKERIIKYFDWFYSDEGMDICSWGPESAGLWALDDNGNKYFVDEQVRYDMLNHVSGGKGADYYGLYDSSMNTYFKYFSKVGACAPYMVNYNPFDPARSAAPNLSIMMVNRMLVSLGGYDMSGRYAYGDGSDTVAAVSSWYWSKFIAEAVAPLLTATTEDEFNTAWDDMYEDFVDDTDYPEAVEMMQDWFAANVAE